MTCPLRAFLSFNIFSVLARSSIIVFPLIEEKFSNVKNSVIKLNKKVKLFNNLK